MKTAFLLFAIAISGVVEAQNVSADDITGLWLTEGGKSKVKVTERDGKYYGKIIWLKEPYEADGKTEKIDDMNDDPALKNRKIVGIEILSGLEFDGDDEWEDGEIYDPESGNSYSCYAEFEGDKLKVRGYMGFSLLGRTTYWTRIK